MNKFVMFYSTGPRKFRAIGFFTWVTDKKFSKNAKEVLDEPEKNLHGTNTLV
jgi:hypothetical protein